MPTLGVGNIIGILMSLKEIPGFSENIKKYLRRSEWRDFPDVVIHSDESLVKRRQLYAHAKAGDADAADGGFIYEGYWH